MNNSSYHPSVSFSFFAFTVIMSMTIIHPLFVIMSAAAATLYYLLLCGGKGIKLIGGIISVFAAVSLINPLLNTGGNTVLFTYFGSRAFTLEALMYGIVTGGMFYSVMLWFACYNIIMTSDKFIFLFGRLIPSVSLILSLVFRLVPNFKNKLIEIDESRKSIGRGAAGGGKEKIHSGVALLSTLTTWALENSIITADSMKSRGYGTCKRTSFGIYKFTAVDVLGVALVAVGVINAVLGAFSGAYSCSFIPEIIIGKMDIWGNISAVIYGLVLFMPSILLLKEAFLWKYLRSKI